MWRVVAAMLCAVLAACAAPLRDRFPPTADAADNHRIWVVSHSWHTGIVVDRAEARGLLAALDDAFPEARYVELGWGDEGFYTAPGGAPVLGLAVKALFTSRGSVLHVVGLLRPPAEEFPLARVEPLVVSDAGFRAMLAAINRSFRRDAAGRGIALRQGIYGNSLFFMALGRYWALYTCNNWTASMLRETGCPITSAYALTAGNTMHQVVAYCRVAGGAP